MPAFCKVPLKPVSVSKEVLKGLEEQDHGAF